MNEFLVILVTCATTFALVLLGGIQDALRDIAKSIRDIVNDKEKP